MKTVKYLIPYSPSNPVHITIIAPENIKFPFEYCIDYHKYCGAGQGIGEKIVPDKIFGVVVSIACFVHDYMWEKAEATWQDFHHSNSVFLLNLINIIINVDYIKYLKFIIKPLSLYRAVTFYSAVTFIGKHIFWKYKMKQGKITWNKMRKLRGI